MAPNSYQFVIRSGPNPGKAFPVSKGEIVIGRDITNDIVINDAEVSRKHARVYQQGTNYILEDLGSTNGTFVNGQRLMGPHTLQPGELVLLGENISLSYEAAPFDPNATVASGASPFEAPPPFQEPAPPPPSFQQPPPQSVYQEPPPPPPYQQPQPEPYHASQPVQPPPFQPVAPPPMMVETPPPEPPRQRGSRTWLMACGGCLLIVLCLCIALFIFVDQPWAQNGGLYCTPPFNTIFEPIIRLLGGSC
jgi:predicted component of type VI protein secretion system